MSDPAGEYLVDANVLIQGANTYYSFAHASGFWAWLAEQINEQKVKTASLVADEIEYPQELVDWVNEQNPTDFYVDVSDPAIQEKFGEIASWVVSQPYGPEHIAKFLNGADPWIIAAASVRGATVVTQEAIVPADSKKVKIPNVCEHFNVRWINAFQLNDELNASF